MGEAFGSGKTRHREAASRAAAGRGSRSAPGNRSPSKLPARAARRARRACARATFQLAAGRADAWIGDRGPGDPLLRSRTATGGIALLLTDREIEELLRGRVYRRVAQRAVMDVADQDELFYLGAMRKIIESCRAAIPSKGRHGRKSFGRSRREGQLAGLSIGWPPDCFCPTSITACECRPRTAPPSRRGRRSWMRPWAGRLPTRSTH